MHYIQFLSMLCMIVFSLVTKDNVFLRYYLYFYILCHLFKKVWLSLLSIQSSNECLITLPLAKKKQIFKKFPTRLLSLSQLLAFRKQADNNRDLQL